MEASSTCCFGGCELYELDPTYKLWRHDQIQGDGPLGTEVSWVAPGCWVAQKKDRHVQIPSHSENLTNLHKSESQQGQTRSSTHHAASTMTKPLTTPLQCLLWWGWNVSQTLLLALDRVDFVTTQLTYSWDWCSCLWMDAWLSKIEVFSPL